MKILTPGDQVQVTTKTYIATGIVVAVFKKAFSDEIRCVVEYCQPEGLLHIHNPDQCFILGKEII